MKLSYLFLEIWCLLNKTTKKTKPFVVVVVIVGVCYDWLKI